MRRAQPIPHKVKLIVYERSKGFCEANLPGCRRLASEVHHRKSRARGGSNDPVNLAHLCSWCHHQVTVHAPGTERWRTHSYQPEGQTEEDWNKDMTEQKLYARALEQWGAEAQINQAQEECGELIVALNHLRRGRITGEAVAEEVADVEQMCGQLRLIIGSDKVDAAKKRKAGRLEKRLDEASK